MELIPQWGDAARTALGFFWKAGWAFVVGYFISGAIQAFVPKARLPAGKPLGSNPPA